MACLTGGFDEGEPSLSEAFLRNASGGALVYLGCSRYGWGDSDSPPASNTSKGGPSCEFMRKFLQIVFGDGISNVGQAFYDHKAAFIASSAGNSCDRWIELALNLQGDPAIQMLTTALPVLHIEATDPTASEPGSDTGTLTITRNIAMGDLIVEYARTGTAVYGLADDYETDPATSAGGTLTMTSGIASVTVTVNPVDNGTAEGDETVVFRLVASTNYALGASSNATVTIVDDDTDATPTVFLETTDAPAAEQGSDPGAFRITRLGSSKTDLTVYYATGGSASPADYTETLTGSTNIPAGQTAVALGITPVDDTYAEGNETVIITLLTNINYLVGATSSGTVTIADNEPRQKVSIVAIDAVAQEEPGPTNLGVFRVSRDGETSHDLVVNYVIDVWSTATNIDYNSGGFQGYLTITSGASYADMVLVPADDEEMEATEVLRIYLVAGTGYYTVVYPNSDAVTILDDDNLPPSVEITDPQDGAAWEIGDEVTILVDASDPDDGISNVEFFAEGFWKIGEATSPPYSIEWVVGCDWTMPPPATFRLSAKVWDHAGAFGTSSVLIINMNPIPPGPGTGITRSWWTNIAGAAVSNLTPSPDYPDNPDGTELLTNAFEGPSSWADNYGTRIAGYFIAPKTGRYRFGVSSDAGHELWLSPDEDPSNKVRIASSTGTNDGYNSTTTEEIELAGQRLYYIEALHKEGSNYDAVAVGVQLPGDRWPGYSIPYHRLTPTRSFRTITASAGANGSIAPDGNVLIPLGGDTNFLITANSYYHIGIIVTNGGTNSMPPGITSTNFTWESISDNGSIHAEFNPNRTTNGTPTWWLAAHGLTNFDADAAADSDHDRLTTWEEYVAGTDPTNDASVFAILDYGYERGSNYVTWYGTTNSGVQTPFGMYRATNLTTPTSRTLASTNIARNPSGTNTWWDAAVPEGSAVFYQPVAPVP